MRGTFKIYQPGREVQITGHIVDFDMELQMAVAIVSATASPRCHPVDCNPDSCLSHQTHPNSQVDFVAVTNGHGMSRGSTLAAPLALSPSKAGRNL
jgi:hypothetical protein